MSIITYFLYEFKRGRFFTLIQIFSGHLIPISRPTPRDAREKTFPAPAESALDVLRAGPKPRKGAFPARFRDGAHDSAVKTTAGTWLGPVVGADVPGGPPPARDVRQSDLVRGGGRARETRAPTVTFARAKNPIRSAIPEQIVERINMPVRIGVHSPELDHIIFVLAIDLKRVYSLGIAACPTALDSRHGHCNKTRAPEQGGV